VKKNILITGGAGFIGSHLCERLLREGAWNVSVVDDLNDFYPPEIKRANLAEVRGHGDINFYEADIRRPDALRPAFEENEFHAIVHLAARAGVRPSLTEPKLYTETNINGTVNLLELAREYGVGQFVFGSSSSVYGVNEKVPFSENDPIFNPISPYAATKAAGELICHNLQPHITLRRYEGGRGTDLPYVFASLRHPHRLPALLHRLRSPAEARPRYT
jgi:UDP-glucuronate 4-epimerase